MRIFKLFLLFLVFLIAIQSKASVTIIPLPPKDKTIADFPFVGSIVNINTLTSGSGTVIGDGSFVITARHVITHNGDQTGLVLDGSNFTFEIDRVKYSVEKVYGNPNTDLAILKLKVKLVHKAFLYDGKNLIGKVFYGSGYGKSSDNASCNCIDWNLSYGTQRIFKNTFEWNDSQAYYENKKIIISSTINYMLHDPISIGQCNGAIEGEGIHGPGDSGGGGFIEEDGELKLASVISAITVNKPYIGIMIKIYSNRAWIEKIIDPHKINFVENEPIPGIIETAFPLPIQEGLWIIRISEVKNRRIKIFRAIKCPEKH